MTIFITSNSGQSIWDIAAGLTAAGAEFTKDEKWNDNRRWSYHFTLNGLNFELTNIIKK